MKVFVSVPFEGRNYDEAERHLDRIVEMLSSHCHDVVTPFDGLLLGDIDDYNDDEPYINIGDVIDAVVACDAVVIGDKWPTDKQCSLVRAAAQIYNLKTIYESCFSFVNFQNLTYDFND